MELTLCSDLPEELIGIITNYIKIINVSNHFHNGNINFKSLLDLIKTHNCILTCRFNDYYDFISNSAIIYGEYSPDHVLKFLLVYCHPFELSIDQLRHDESHSWKKKLFYEADKLENVKYSRHYSLVTNSNTTEIIGIRFMSVNIKLQNYKELIGDKNIMIDFT